jgi:hypothetical protein
MGSEIRDLPLCSIVPQSITLPSAAKLTYIVCRVIQQNALLPSVHALDKASKKASHKQRTPASSIAQLKSLLLLCAAR